MGAVRTYSIGDIHGHLDKLQELHRWITADLSGFNGDAKIVHVGDLVDRGPNSAGVLDWLAAGVAADEPWVVLKGNHDRMMAHYLQYPMSRDPRLRLNLDWLHPRLGGVETLASYGVTASEHYDDPEVHSAMRAATPDHHVAFLAGLDTVYERDGVVYVHAGIQPGVPIAEQTEDDLVWIRAPFLEFTGDHGALIVHGHTPVDDVTHYGNRINIDTGAAYGGPMSAIVIEDGEVFQLTNSGRTPVLPEQA